MRAGKNLSMVLHGVCLHLGPDRIRSVGLSETWRDRPWFLALYHAEKDVIHHDEKDALKATDMMLETCVLPGAPMSLCVGGHLWAFF